MADILNEMLSPSWMKALGNGFGSNAPKQTIAQASTNSGEVINDWRVRLAVPSQFRNSEILNPLGSHMIFPFTPTIILGHSANYTQIAPTHSNYPFQSYRNSEIQQITITGEFISENAEDAKYWLAAVHFLRTMTKMFYGDTGAPPPISRLSGYGRHVFDRVPVVITNFTTDLLGDNDYIKCVVDGKDNYVPVSSTITVTASPTYARALVSQFTLKDFADGKLSDKGFI